MVIRSRRQLNQFQEFAGLGFGRLQPSDIDLVLELKDKAYLIVEVKREGAPHPRGQLLMYERMAADLHKAGKHVLLVYATHTTPIRKDIDVARCNVHSYMTKPRRPKNSNRIHGWEYPLQKSPVTVRELVDAKLDEWGIDV